MTVYPEAYQLHPVYIQLGNEKIQSFSIRIPHDAVALDFVSKLDKSSQGVKFAPTLTRPSGNALGEKFEVVQKLTQEKLIRGIEFQKRLEERVKNQHQKFLTEKCLTWTFSPTLPKWHPDFNLATVEPIPEADLPLKKTGSSFLQSLKKKSGTVTPPPKKADAKEPPSSAGVTTAKPATPVLGKDGKPLSRAQALLERVRDPPSKPE